MTGVTSGEVSLVLFGIKMQKDGHYIYNFLSCCLYPQKYLNNVGI